MQVVYGQTKNKAVADRLIGAVGPSDIAGTLYIGYPVLASADEPITVDALLVSEQHGLVAFLFAGAVPANPEGWARLAGDQDKVYFALRTYLSRHEALRKGRELAFELNTVTLVPALPAIVPEGTANFADVQTLISKISKFSPLDIKYEKPLNAALQRVSTLRPAKRRVLATNPTSRGGVLKRLEQEIANLDQWQKAAAIGSPEGPQRIRGIAGSGKTVVLALKAAYLPLAEPRVEHRCYISHEIVIPAVHRLDSSLHL